MRINQNIAAFNAYRNLTVSGNQMNKSLEKLSSGFRINRAADDAAGLVISQGLRAQVSGLRQATRNAQDGISVVQVAEGALNEVHSMLNRMRDLAVQSANASNDDAARAASNDEVGQLLDEISRISASTKFGSKNLLDGTFGTTPAAASGYDADNSITVTADGDGFDLAFDTTGDGATDTTVTVALSAGVYTGSQFAAHVQSSIDNALELAGGTAAEHVGKFKVNAEAVGAGTAVTVEGSLVDNGIFTLTDGLNTPLAQLGMAAATSTASDGTGADFQVGAFNTANDRISVTLDAVTTAAFGKDAVDISGVDVSTAAGAQAAIDSIDDAITSLSKTRAELGAYQNRFESTINNLQVGVENIAASESRIRDTDMALEMTEFTRTQILQQAGTAMLGQANQIPQSVLRLLG